MINQVQIIKGVLKNGRRGMAHGGFSTAGMFLGENNNRQEMRHSVGRSMAIINDAEAASFLEVIVNGVDPTTGAVITSDSVLQSADAVRSLNRAVQALKRRVATQKKKAALPARAGAKWDSDEDRFLTDLAKSGASVADLSKTLDRTRGAVLARLERLGLTIIVEKPLSQTGSVEH